MLNRPLEFNGQSYTIVGVLDPRFTLPATDADVLAAFVPHAGPEAEARGAHTLRAFVRLKPGISKRQAQEELDAIAVRLEQHTRRRIAKCASSFSH